MIKFFKEYYQVMCALIAFVCIFLGCGITCTSPTENWLWGLISLAVAEIFVKIGRLDTYSP